jgi:hypothetical protein
MKYIAPAVLNTVNATDLIQGGKLGINQDNPQEPSVAPGYDADE